MMKMMAIQSISRCHIWFFIVVLLQLQCHVLGNQFKVGDLNGWNVPPSANPDVYMKWSQNHTINIGDSLLFLYPPSQDSVILVTNQSYESCNLKDPVLSMNDGNSVFNITCPGDYYFTSSVRGHCQNKQKLHISVSGNGTCSALSAYAPAPLPLLSAASPSSNNPLQETSSSALIFHASPVSLLSAVIGLLLYA